VRMDGSDARTDAAQACVWMAPTAVWTALEVAWTTTTLVRKPPTRVWLPPTGVRPTRTVVPAARAVVWTARAAVGTALHPLGGRRQTFRALASRAPRAGRMFAGTLAGNPARCGRIGPDDSWDGGTTPPQKPPSEGCPTFGCRSSAEAARFQVCFYAPARRGRVSPDAYTQPSISLTSLSKRRKLVSK
jgi:hypothetical protein